MTASPEYAAKRAIRVTRNQQRAAKRMYEEMAGRLRSQLRKQVDELIKPNQRDWIFLLLQGGKIRLLVETTASEPAPVIDEPTEPTTAELEAAARSLGLDLNSGPNVQARAPKPLDLGPELSPDLNTAGALEAAERAVDELRTGVIPKPLLEIVSR